MSSASSASLPPALAARLAKRGILQTGKAKKKKALKRKTKFVPYEDDLPSGWHPVVDVATGDIYFWHVERNETQWELPTEEAEKQRQEAWEEHQRYMQEQMQAYQAPPEHMGHAHLQQQQHAPAQPQGQGQQQQTMPFGMGLMPAAPPVMRPPGGMSQPPPQQQQPQPPPPQQQQQQTQMASVASGGKAPLISGPPPPLMTQPPQAMMGPPMRPPPPPQQQPPPPQPVRMEYTMPGARPSAKRAQEEQGTSQTKKPAYSS